MDLWTNSWIESIDGSWIVCGGVTVSSVCMIMFSSQENDCSSDARAGNVSGVPAHPEPSSLKFSDRIREEDAIDEDEGELRFGTIPKFWLLKNSASTKPRPIEKSGYQLVRYSFDGIECRYTLGICGYLRRFEAFYRNQRW